MYLLLETLCLLFILQTIGFGLALWTQKNCIADVFWGLTIAISAAWIIVPLLSVVLTTAPSLIIFMPSLIAGILTFIWGLRLTLHIGQRFIKKKTEDKRYAQMSVNWESFYLRSYLQFFLLQGLLMLAMLTPVLATTLVAPEVNLYFIFFGILVWLFGLSFEVIADWQLAQFVKTKQSGQIMQSGLWRYSRHPNYFGEVTLWWGIWLVTLPFDWWYISLIAPLTITFLILKVSGVPLAEAHYADNEAFQAYAQRTSKFFPWKPKSS